MQWMYNLKSWEWPTHSFSMQCEVYAKIKMFHVSQSSTIQIYGKLQTAQNLCVCVRACLRVHACVCVTGGSGNQTFPSTSSALLCRKRAAEDSGLWRHPSELGRGGPRWHLSWHEQPVATSVQIAHWHQQHGKSALGPRTETPAVFGSTRACIKERRHGAELRFRRRGGFLVKPIH